MKKWRNPMGHKVHFLISWTILPPFINNNVKWENANKLYHAWHNMFTFKIPKKVLKAARDRGGMAYRLTWKGLSNIKLACILISVPNKYMRWPLECCDFLSVRPNEFTSLNSNTKKIKWTLPNCIPLPIGKTQSVNEVFYDCHK